jgi:FlaA1/EpsC-like NDP-sugar epimerase
VQSAAVRSRPEQKFVSVRFGNVLGSRGSVIPVFKNQILSGGPVTVTHPDMTRYFMTIPEASQLVMQAAGQGKNGEIYILDMGEPVRIVDLAKDLIKLSGFEPDVDIPIAFSGVRPGEKLYEELMTNEEKGGATAHEKIFVAKPSLLELEALDRTVQVLQEAALKSDYATIRRQLKAFISGSMIDDVVA